MESSMVLFTIVFTDETKKLRAAMSCSPLLVRFLWVKEVSRLYWFVSIFYDLPESLRYRGIPPAAPGTCGPGQRSTRPGSSGEVTGDSW